MDVEENQDGCLGYMWTILPSKSAELRPKFYSDNSLNKY